MALLDFFVSLFSSQHREYRKALKKLRYELKKHEVIQYYLEETLSILINFSKQRRRSHAKNVGLVIRGTMNVGKTRFITKILKPYFLTTGLINQNLIYKIHTRGINIQKPIFKTIVEFGAAPISFEQIFDSLEPGGIIIVDNLHIQAPHFPAIINQVKLLLASKKHAKTLVILCASFKKLEKMRPRFEINAAFPTEFEIKIEPSLEQISELFMQYVKCRGFKINRNTIPTLKYYFSIRYQNSKFTNILIGQKKLNSSHYLYFAYKTEFPKLLTSITEISLPDQINISTIRKSAIFLEACTLNQKLKYYL